MESSIGAPRCRTISDDGLHKVTDQCERAVRVVLEHRMAAIGQSLEADDLRAECVGKFLAELDGGDRILLTTKNERWACDPRQAGPEVHAMILAVRLDKVRHDRRSQDGTVGFVGQRRRGARSKERDADLDELEGGILARLAEEAGRDRSGKRSAAPREDAHRSPRVEARRRADEDERRRMIGILRGIGLSDEAAKRGADDDRPVNAEVLAKAL